VLDLDLYLSPLMENITKVIMDQESETLRHNIYFSGW
jgi:hypothetical protein